MKCTVSRRQSRIKWIRYYATETDPIQKCIRAEKWNHLKRTLYILYCVYHAHASTFWYSYSCHGVLSRTLYVTHPDYTDQIKSITNNIDSDSTF